MSIFLTLTLIVITCLVYYFLRSFSYWKRKNVPYITPYFPLGSIGLSFPKYAYEQFAKFYKTFKSSGARYGGFYLSSMPVFMPVHPESIKEVLTSYFEHFQDRGTYCEEELEPLTCNIFMTSGLQWKHMRQKLSPTFTSGKMKNMFNIILQCGHDIQSVLDQACNKNEALDIKELAAGYTTDVIASCAFGIECKSILNPNEDFRKYGRIFFDNDFIQQTKMLMGFLTPALLKFFKIPFFKPLVAKYITSVVKETVAYREENNVERKDFMDLLIKIKNKENISDEDVLPHAKNGSDLQNNALNDGLTTDQMAAQAFIFYVAGFETSSTTTTFLMLELAQNQDIQDKVRKEIHAVLEKHDGKLTYDGVMEMTDMDCVINDDIQFPKDEGSSPLSNAFIPQVNYTDCKNDMCLDVTNYPADHIEKLLQRNLKRHKYLLAEDVVDISIAHRFNAMATQDLCASKKMLQEPQAGKNQNDNWLFLVNHGEYKQAIETEICENESDVCNMGINFPVKTKCKQKYILRKMLTLDPKSGVLKPDTIKLPSCCSCHYFP